MRTNIDANQVIAKLRSNYFNYYYEQAMNRSIGIIIPEKPNASALLFDSLADNQNYQLLLPNSRDNIINYLITQKFNKQ